MTAFSAYIQVIRLGSAEIGTALISTWLRVREQVHSNWLGKSIENGDAVVANMRSQLSTRLADHGASIAPERALGTLAKLVQREANVLAYIDGFWLTFAAAILALFLLALIGPPPPGPLAPASKSAKSSSPNSRKSRRISKPCFWQLPIFRRE